MAKKNEVSNLLLEHTLGSIYMNLGQQYSPGIAAGFFLARQEVDALVEMKETKNVDCELDDDTASGSYGAFVFFFGCETYLRQ